MTHQIYIPLNFVIINNKTKIQINQSFLAGFSFCQANGKNWQKLVFAGLNRQQPAKNG